MAVYKRTYRGYSGPLTPTWSRFLVLYRFSRERPCFDRNYRRRFSCFASSFPCCACSASTPTTISAHSLSSASRKEPLSRGERQVLSALFELPGSVRLSSDRLHRAQVWSRRISPTALCRFILPAAFAHRICARQNVCAGHPALVDHLDSGLVSVLRPGESFRHRSGCWTTCGLLSGIVARFVRLDSYSVAAGIGPFGLGEMAACRGSSACSA